MENLGKIPFFPKIPFSVKRRRKLVEEMKAGREEDSSSDKSPAISGRVSFSKEHRPTRFHPRLPYTCPTDI